MPSHAALSALKSVTHLATAGRQDAMTTRAGGPPNLSSNPEGAPSKLCLGGNFIASTKDPLSI